MRYLKLLILTSLLTTITSCSLFLSKPRVDFRRYITGEGLNEKTSQDIISSLTRFGYLGGGNYEVKAYPITLPLIESEAKELQALRGFNKAQLNKIINKKRIEYTEQKTCFQLNYSVIRFKEVAPLKSWKAYIVTKDQTEFPVKWKESSLKKKPISSIITGLYGIESKWYNEGIGCVDVGLPIEKGFLIKLVPSYVQWPFPDSASLTWGMPELTFQSYRGY